MALERTFPLSRSVPIDDCPQRPFAARNLILRDVEVDGGEMIFAIDPSTQRWGIISDIAKRLLALADGRRPLYEIEELLLKHTRTGPHEVTQLCADLLEHGLLHENAEVHREAGGGIYRKAISPLGLHLEITNACNLRCEHCYVSSGRRLPDELSTEELLSVVDQLSSFSDKRIVITGGEPTAHRDCMRIVEYCAKTCGHHVDLYTNGIRVDGCIDRLKEIQSRVDVQIRLQVSLEGARRETNDLVRGAGSFDATIRTLRRLKQEGMNRSTVLFVCVTKHNIDETDEIIKLAENFDLSMLVFSQWQRQGYAKSISWQEIAPTMEQWTETGEKILEYADSGLRVFGNFFGDTVNDPNGRYSLDGSLFPKHVYWYDAFPRVAPNGDVFADQLFIDRPWCLGNVRQNTLDELLNGPTIFGHLQAMRSRSEQTDKCRACAWRDVCGSGSPGHTYSEYGELNRPDVFCEPRIYWFERFVDHQVRKANLALAR